MIEIGLEEDLRPFCRGSAMSISRKGKRPITVDGREFLWWVTVDEEFTYSPTLHIVSDCGAVFVKAPLRTAEGGYAVTLGAEFRGAKMTQGKHRRFLRAGVGDGESVKPGDVANLIRWAVEPGPATELLWPRQTVEWNPK